MVAFAQSNVTSNNACPRGCNDFGDCLDTCVCWTPAQNGSDCFGTFDKLYGDNFIQQNVIAIVAYGQFSFFGTYLFISNKLWVIRGNNGNRIMKTSLALMVLLGNWIRFLFFAIDPYGYKRIFNRLTVAFLINLPTYLLLSCLLLIVALW